MNAVAASPWLTTLEAAAYVRCLSRDGQPSRPAFRAWARRHGVVFIYRGRRVLVARADLDRELLGDPKPRRRQRATNRASGLSERASASRGETMSVSAVQGGRP